VRDFDVEVFFDGDCPLCSREIDLLRRLDKKGRIVFTDITSPEFDAGALGLDPGALMERLHARLPDGEVVAGVEVLRRLYAAVGFERAVAISRVPGVSGALDLAYALFAKNRLRLTGRCVKGEDGACAVEAPAKGAGAATKA